MGNTNIDGFATLSTTSTQFSFAAGGVVWQFQFQIKDSCGTTVVKGNDFAETIGVWAQPCCLPGLFKNAAYANGGCHGGPVIGKVCNMNAPPPPCDPVEGSTETPVAAWVPVAGSPGAMHLSYTQGSTRDFTVSNADKWGSNAASKAGISFIIGNSSSGHSGASVAASYRRHFIAASSTTSTQFSFAAGGVVWQFQFKIKDSCGTTVVKGNHFAETIGNWAEPCCLPGFFKNAAYANGDCHGFTLTNAKVCSINPVSATSAKFLV